MPDHALVQIDRLLASGCAEHMRRNAYTRSTPVLCPWCRNWVPEGHSLKLCRIDNEDAT